MFFLCYSLTRHKNPLEIFPCGDPPVPTGKLGKLTPPPPGKSDPFRGGGMDIFWNHTMSFCLVTYALNTTVNIVSKDFNILVQLGFYGHE